jgi:hypothetical protein
VAYTEQALSNDAYEILRLRGPVPPSAIPRIRVLIPLAMEELGKTFAASDYEGLQKSFAVTITAGRADLKDVEGLLFNPLRSVVFPPSSTTPAIWQPDTADLVWGNMVIGSSEPVYYTQEGTVLVFRNNADGSISTLAGTGAVVTNYVPSLIDAARPLPVQYEGLLLKTLVELASGAGISAVESAQVGRA